MLKIQPTQNSTQNCTQNKPCGRFGGISFKAFERTLFALKPDAFERGLNPDILAELNQNLPNLGLKLKKGFAWLGTPTKELMERHYAEHKDKSFFETLINYVTSGKMYALVVEGDDAVSKIRNFAKGIRAKHFLPGDKTKNLVHSSDSVASAEREIANFFPDSK